MVSDFKEVISCVLNADSADTLQARSQKLNKQEEIHSPYPPFPLEVGPLRRLQLEDVGERSSSPSGSGRSPATNRIRALENASIATTLWFFYVIVLYVVSPVIQHTPV